MKATFTQKGKKYIYKVDGKVVRTSENQYDYVAVSLYNGEFSEVLACGKLTTCSAAAGKRSISLRILKAKVNFLNGKVDYQTYCRLVGASYAMSVKKVKQIKEQGTRAQEIETSKRIIDELEQYSEQILKFEAEF